jgi:NhaP-type Na+/H+ or K+/H+ antiporter
LWLPAVVSHRFELSTLVLGLLLVAGALLAALSRRSVLALTAVFVIAGFVLGDGVTGALHFSAGSGFVSELATVALIVILFRDGLEVEGELLQSHWRVPFRKLALAMPLTAAIVALATRWLTGLSWTESFLVGALLSPTDPVLSSSVVTNPRVPRLIRHSLNLESGLNDGLALPAVLALAAVLSPHQNGFVWWRFLLENLGFGFGVGIAVGTLAARLIPREESDQALFGLGTAFAAYGVAVLLPSGNGLIAVFVAAIALGVQRPDIRGPFERQATGMVEVVKLGIFVVFGSLLTAHGLLHDGWAAIGVAAVTLLVARPVAVFAALAGTPPDLPERAFMAWFGPKGVATMTFSILILSEHVSRGAEIFSLAALTVFVSIIVHGASDTAGSEWMARRAERAAAAGTSVPGDGAPQAAAVSAGRRDATDP